MVETPQYRILFSYDRKTARKDSVNPKIRFVELSYKYTDLEELPGERYSVVGGGKIRFLDKEGFALAVDYFSTDDLELGDLYGFLWVEEDSAKKMVSADAVPLRFEEWPLLKKAKAQRGTPLMAPVPALPPALLSEIPASPSPSPTPTPTSTPTPSPSVSPEPEPSTEPEEPPTPSPSPSFHVPFKPAPPRDALNRGGIDNDEVQETLKEQEKDPETEIPPSETTLDLPPSDNEGAQEDSKTGVIIKQTFL